MARSANLDFFAAEADQQAVFNRFLQSGPNDRIMQPNSTSTAAQGAVKPEFVLARADIEPASVYYWPIYADLAPDVPLPLAHALAEELLSDVAHIGPKLGMTVITPMTMPRNTTSNTRLPRQT